MAFKGSPYDLPASSANMETTCKLLMHTRPSVPHLVVTDSMASVPSTVKTAQASRITT